MSNQIGKSIINFMQVMHKEVFSGFKGNKVENISNKILYTIMNDDGKPMNHYCNLLSISKPNFTKASNKLIEENLLIRKYDDNDRRIIRLFITDIGKNNVVNKRIEMEEKLSNKFESLSNEDILELIKSFESIEKILNKLGEVKWLNCWKV